MACASSQRPPTATGANVDTWYHCDRLGNVMLTSNSAGASNGLRWQDAYGSELSRVVSGAWASAVNADGYGLTTKEYDGDVEFPHFSSRWIESRTGSIVTESDQVFYRVYSGNSTSGRSLMGRPCNCWLKVGQLSISLETVSRCFWIKDS